jgi:hypothetical protein
VTVTFLQTDGLLTPAVGLIAVFAVPPAVAVHPAAFVAVTVYGPGTTVEILAVVAVVLHT